MIPLHNIQSCAGQDQTSKQTHEICMTPFTGHRLLSLCVSMTSVTGHIRLQCAQKYSKTMHRTQQKSCKIMQNSKQLSKRLNSKPNAAYGMNLLTSTHPRPRVRRKILENKRRVLITVQPTDFEIGGLAPQTCLGPSASEPPAFCFLCHSLCSFYTVQKCPAASMCKYQNLMM